jgi:DNA recombination protein RmuC
MDATIAQVILSVITLVAVIMLTMRGRAKPDQSSLVLLQDQLNAMQGRLDAFGQKVDKTLRSSVAQMNSRLDSATKVVGDLREKVGQIHEIGKAAHELVNILRAPKLRGGMGELFLGDLLAQILPPEHYELQHRFSSGEAVDAAIKVGQKVVPVDSKFPYDNFKRVVDAGNETDRTSARKRFLKDVKQHVDAISTKYIRSDEGTYDFALMYIPAENVYYETIIKVGPSEEHELFGYALQRRVIPVSPNSFYAYLQTILLGLRGMTMEQKGQEILAALNGLRDDFDKLEESFRLVGTHLKNATRSYNDSERLLTAFDVKLTRIEQPILTGHDKSLASARGGEGVRDIGAGDRELVSEIDGDESRVEDEVRAARRRR